MGKIRRQLPLILLLAALALVAVGIWTKEPAVMWRKAVNICLSCMGIG